jgi:hypothetical protein
MITFRHKQIVIKYDGMNGNDEHDDEAGSNCRRELVSEKV